MSDWLELSQLIIIVQRKNNYKVKHIFYNFDSIFSSTGYVKDKHLIWNESTEASLKLLFNIYRDNRDAWKRVSRGLSEVYPSEPPGNPQATPRQPPRNYEQMMERKNCSESLLE